jgi:hypothetical protein
MMDYSTGKKAEAAAAAKAPTADAWKACQKALNELGLAQPPLALDGDPGEKTLMAAQGLVPLIEKTQRRD